MSPAKEAVRTLSHDDLHGRAGRHEWGYVEPDQAAVVLLEEAVNPFLEDLKRKLELALEVEALEICEAIVLGLYRTQKGKASELLEYAPEFPEESAGWTVDVWRAGGDEDKAARRPRGVPGRGSSASQGRCPHEPDPAGERIRHVPGIHPGGAQAQAELHQAA